MTIDEYIAKLETRVNELNEAAVVFPVAAKVVEMQTERIFGRGENANGSQFGVYSTKPEYYTKKQFKNTAAFKGIGKTGETKFKDGTPHVSMYLPSGYKQLKQVQSYESGFVNLTYSADLRQDFATSLTQQGSTYVSKLKHTSVGKLKGLEDKYGRIFAFSKDEIEVFRTGVQASLMKFLFGTQRVS
jgi:chromatin segregation and condensation protein Rec8/ScpA/Scc1 (kleisin family)